MSMDYLSRSYRLALSAVIAGALGSFTLAACGTASSDKEKPTAAAGQKGAQKEQAKLAREKAFAAARVWAAPATPIGEANLRDNPPGPGAFSADAEVSCSFKIEKFSGTTPKFHCELPNGEVLKIKYGSGNAELQAEVAATRLLARSASPRTACTS